MNQNNNNKLYNLEELNQEQLIRIISKLVNQRDELVREVVELRHQLGQQSV